MKNKYFIAVIPPEPLQSELMQLKHEVADRFKSKAALRSPAHITLHMPFEMEGAKEERFLDGFASFHTSLQPFSIRLYGFDFFSPRVVFVNVVQSGELRQLQSDVVDFMKTRFNIFNQSEDMRGFHPHITIAFRDLKKSEFHNAREYYTQRTFTGGFVGSALSLLRHDGQRWNEYKSVEIKKP